MKPEAYFLNIQKHFLNNSVVDQFRITRQRVTDSDTFFEARLTLVDGSYLQISEYGEGNDIDDIQVIMYTYHWMDADNNLIIRWDNASHYPNLPGFPHHLHDGDEKNVRPGEPMSLFKVLAQIAARLGN